MTTATTTMTKTIGSIIASRLTEDVSLSAAISPTNQLELDQPNRKIIRINRIIIIKISNWIEFKAGFKRWGHCTTGYVCGDLVFILFSRHFSIFSDVLL